MPEYLTPGVYVEELDTGNKPIEGVSTSTARFLGVAERGPAKLTLITSYTDFARAFGSYYVANNQQYYLAYSVEGFFRNRGQRCFVQAVFPATAGPATQAADKIDISAISGGLWGNQVAIKVEKSGSGTGIRLTAMYWPDIPPNAALKVDVDPTSRTPADLRSADRREPQVIEVFDDLDANPLSTNYYENQINGISNLITVTQSAAGVPNVQALILLDGGTAGGALALADFEGDSTKPPGQKTGLDAFTEIDEISLLCCPDAYALGNNDDINNALIDQCEVLKSRFAILSSTSHEPLPLGISFNSKYAAFYYPWVNVINPTTGAKVLVAPGGHVAGIYARSDDARGVQKDPANEVIRGIDSLQFKLTDGQQALLSSNS